MSVKVKIMTIPGAPLEGTNPLPMFHNKNEVNTKAHPDFPAELRVDLGNRSPILPYKMQDRYSRKRLPPLSLQNFLFSKFLWKNEKKRDKTR